MALYSYKAKTKKGEIIEDVMQAADRKDVATALTSENYQVLTIRKIDTKTGSFTGGSISVSEKAAFCRFLATMLRAGLTLPKAMEIIKEETKNKKLEKVLYDLSYEVRRGKTISSVLAKYKNDFDPVFLTMVKAGEESGTLDKSFDYLAKQLLSSYELSQKIKGAMMYPAVIVCAMLAEFTIMLVFVLPKLSDVFLELNVPLPATTKFILGIGSFVGKNTVEVIVGLLIALIIIGLIFFIQKARAAIVNFLLKLPAIKKVTTEVDIARFARTLGTLLKSGVPIMVSLDVCADVIRQPQLKKQAKLFSAGVASGKTLSEIITSGKNPFPPTVTQTIKAGEESGSLEEVLEEMADFYEKEVDYNIKKLTTLLEPLLMLIIGIAVGAMVVMMITPIYSLVGGMGKF
jgi:type IV pilus assembly protein PilC